MTTMNVKPTGWQRSSYSTTQENCVEIARTTRQAAVRDSKDPDGPALVFGTRAFALFVEGLRGRG